jgi:hypothetical protein
MAQPVTMIRVFWSAPGDVVAEHDAFLDTINEWNSAHSAATSAVLKPVSWRSDTFPDAGRPQAVINQQALDASDIVIAVFWSRFGTPTGVADSGSEEEIRRSVVAGKPVMLYFCERRVPPDAVDVDQMARLARFKEESRKAALVHSYREAQEFRQALSQHLSMAVNVVLRRLRSEAVGSSTAPSPPRQNVVEFTGGHNVGNVVHQTVVHKYGAKRKPPTAHPEGSIGADIHRRNYVRYLTKRYNEYREADPSYGRSAKFSYAFIHKRVEQEFGSPTNFLPVDLFDAVCEFLKRYVDGTIQGKRNRKNRTGNYPSFEEFIVEQRALATRPRRGNRKSE